MLAEGKRARYGSRYYAILGRRDEAGPLLHGFLSHLDHQRCIIFPYYDPIDPPFELVGR